MTNLAFPCLCWGLLYGNGSQLICRLWDQEAGGWSMTVGSDQDEGRNSTCTLSN
jgi:hypothetical protein